MNWVVRVNTRTGEVSRTKVSAEEQRWGGRLFIAKLLLKEVPPACEPLGRYNKLILASGLLGDTHVSTAGQLSIGGKSPLTGGVKESNVGGLVGKKLARMGLKALIIEDIPQGSITGVLVVRADDVRLIDVPELKDAMVSDTIEILRSKFGTRNGFLCIGPAGEKLMYSAGVASTDEKALQVRYAARGGLGAVMGSKGIKAIVVDDQGAKSPVYYDAALLNETARKIMRDLEADPKTENRHSFGTPGILRLANEVGLMPTRNFTSGQFEQAHKMTGDQISKLIADRGGEGRSGTPCIPGCTIQCSNIFPDKDGKRIVASLQYESIVLLGSNCGIGDVDAIAELNHLCNQVGVDTIETGAAIGVAMEAGVIQFGDAEGAKDIVKQIGLGTYLGRIIGHGAVLTGRVFGIKRVPAVKGQAMPAYDPRALKGSGVTYVTSPMGADHTAGNVFETLKSTNPLGTENQVETSRRLQLRAAILDSLGVCLFLRPPFVRHPEFFGLLLKGRYGWELSIGDVKRMGLEVLETEREFNRRAGVSEELFPMPEFMVEEPLPPHNTVFDISQEEVQRFWTLDVFENEF